MQSADEKGQGLFPFHTPALQRRSVSRFQLLKLVPVSNQSAAAFMIDLSTTEAFVVKRGLQLSDVQAEAVSWLLSRELQLRTPEACVVEPEPLPMVEDEDPVGATPVPLSPTAGRQGWASRAVEHVLPWEPDEADLCNQRDLCGIFLLDAIVGNTDRHENNVLVADSTNSAAREVHSIDLASSWCGDAQFLSARDLDVPSDCKFLRGVSREGIEACAAPLIQACEELAQAGDRLGALAYNVCSVVRGIPEGHQDVLMRALQRRLANAGDLFMRFLDGTVGRP